MRHVIVGNGVAGIEAAVGLRARDGASPIVIVSDEHDHFFSRPALMYVFAGQQSLRDTEPYDRGFYERMGFERVRGRVVGLDGGRRMLLLADGRELGWDKLLLATGSRAREAPWPGAEGPGLHAFVTLRDLESLDREARPGLRAVVVGGGLIGVEVAEILHDRGLSVTFAIREAWAFPAALDAAEAAIVAEHVRGHGVDVRLGRVVRSIERHDDGRIRAVRLESTQDAAPDPEEVPADFVVVAIGVVPNTGFLEGSGVARASSGAIEVDEALRTSLADVWAAGDCANVSWWDGTRRPEQLWYTAREQGRAAARSIRGEAVAYRRSALYNSAKFFDLEYTTAGVVPVELDLESRPVPPPAGVRSAFEREAERLASRRIVSRDGVVIGFNMLGERWDHERLQQWIDEARGVDWVRAHLDEARFDEELTPARPGKRGA